MSAPAKNVIRGVSAEPRATIEEGLEAHHVSHRDFARTP